MPRVKDSSQAIDKPIRMNQPFSKHDLAAMALRCFPAAFCDQYTTTESRQPQEIQPLRVKIEMIKNIVDSTAEFQKKQARPIQQPRDPSRE